MYIQKIIKTVKYVLNITIQILLSTFQLQHSKLKPTQNNILWQSIPKQINNPPQEYNQQCPTQLFIIQLHNDSSNNLKYTTTVDDNDKNKVFEGRLEVMNNDDTDTYTNTDSDANADANTNSDTDTDVDTNYDSDTDSN